MRKTILAGVLVVILGLYFSGRLDYVLYPVGLNFHTCARNGFGATFCGADLTAYEARIRGVQQQFQSAQQQIQRSEANLTQQECQADPALSICSP